MRIVITLTIEYREEGHGHNDDLESQDGGTQKMDVVDTVNPKRLISDENARRLVLLLEIVMVIIQLVIMFIL